VRPEARAHVAGAAAEDLDADELIPVREAVRPPAFPTVHVVTALALLMLTLGMAFAGPTAETDDETLAPGTLEVAGVDPTTQRIPTLDLSEPVPITVGSRHADADAVRLRLTVADIPLSRERREALEPAGEGASTLIGVQGSRYVAAGTVTAELDVLRDERAVATYEFGVRNGQQPWLTLPGALIVALVLFSVAYAESFLRHMRRGRRRVTGVLGMPLVGAGGGIAALGIAWLLGGRPPVVPTAIAVAVLGAGAGLAAALAALRLGTRRRIRRTQGEA
jgi:serine/threonine-protein kinase